MTASKQTAHIIICPNENHLYQFRSYAENIDYWITVNKQLDYEMPDDTFLVLEKNHTQTKQITVNDFLKPIDQPVKIKLIYCSRNVHEYLTMLYFESLCKQHELSVYNFSKQRSYSQDHIDYTVWFHSCNEIDIHSYHAAMNDAEAITPLQKENMHQLWRQLKDQNKLKCFINANSQAIQLLEHNAFDDKIIQLNQQQSFAKTYHYFLNEYGLSERWLKHRCTYLGILDKT